MADIDVVEKESGGSGFGGSPTLIWAVVAILAVGGLFVWLAVASSRTTGTAVVQEERAERVERGAVPADPEAGDAAVFADVAAAPDPYIGQRLEFEDVEVAATLGPTAFWGDVPGANPFLVVIAPEAGDPGLEGGQTYDIRGVVNLVTEELVSEWVESGAIRPGARDEASFATHYLLAERIQP
jgi:hypothetical protein